MYIPLETVFLGSVFSVGRYDWVTLTGVSERYLPPRIPPYPPIYIGDLRFQAGRGYPHTGLLSEEPSGLWTTLAPERKRSSRDRAQHRNQRTVESTIAMSFK